MCVTYLVSGFTLGGFGMGETATDRAELLEAVMVYYSSFEVSFILLLICF